MSVVYPNLVGEVTKRGIRKSVIASTIGISERALYNKFLGTVPFTWPEACKIQEVFFPDMDKDTLFLKIDEPNS